MFLPHFNLIVTTDANNGIAKDGGMPWNSASIATFFRDTTRGDGKNAVIMGRKTYESLTNKTLEGRTMVVISTTLQQQFTQSVFVYPGLIEALSNLGQRYSSIYIIGGETLFNEAVGRFLYLCDRIFVTKLKISYDCTKFFPWDDIKDLPQETNPVKSIDWSRYVFNPSKAIKHPEVDYIQLLDKTLHAGENRPDDTGAGVRMLFGERLVFDVRRGIPFMTVFPVATDSMIKEAMMYLTGKTDVRELAEYAGHRWTSNTSRKYHESAGRALVAGDMGATPASEWKNWGQDYRGCESTDTEGLNQLQPLLESLRTSPLAGPHLLVAWDPYTEDMSVLPQNEILTQFFVSSDRLWLDCFVFVKKVNLFGDAPYLIGLYSVVHHLVAHLVGLRPRTFQFSMGEVYVPIPLAGNIEKVITRTPRPWPRFSIVDGERIQTMSRMTTENIHIAQYSSWPHIARDL